jgi:hypothetical protein
MSEHTLERAAQEFADATAQAPFLHELRPEGAVTDHHADQLQFLRELLQENASIECDILKWGSDNWAIHGVFPYDGEVPMAVFDTYEEAQRALNEVRGITPPMMDI